MKYFYSENVPLIIDATECCFRDFKTWTYFIELTISIFQYTSLIRLLKLLWEVVQAKQMFNLPFLFFNKKVNVLKIKD